MLQKFFCNYVFQLEIDMKTLSLFAVALFASAALLSSGCSEPKTAPAPPAVDGGGEDAAGSSTSSTTTEGEGSAELTSVSFNVKGMT